MYPDTDDPKLSFIVALADVLEWPVDAIADYLWAGLSPEPAADVEAVGDFDAAREQHKAAYFSGDYARALELCRALHSLAQTSDQRAIAANRESLAWEGLGRYTRALSALRRGLAETPIARERRLTMRSNLANTYYDLWELDSACGVAQALLEWFAAHPALSFKSRVTQAFAYYARGNSFRRLAGIEPDDQEQHARRAKSDLEAARSLFTHLSEEGARDDLAAIAHTCQSGLCEVAVLLRERDPADAVAELIGELDAVVDVDGGKVGGGWLESYGWTALFGANIALRHLDGRRLERVMAIFTNMAMEIVKKAGNAGFAAGVYTMEYNYQKRVAEEAGTELCFMLDDEDVAMIVAAMGGMPRFRTVGYEMLRCGTIVAGEPHKTHPNADRGRVEPAIPACV